MVCEAVRSGCTSLIHRRSHRLHEQHLCDSGIAGEVFFTRRDDAPLLEPEVCVGAGVDICRREDLSGWPHRQDTSRDFALRYASPDCGWCGVLDVEYPDQTRQDLVDDSLTSPSAWITAGRQLTVRNCRRLSTSLTKQSGGSYVHAGDCIGDTHHPFLNQHVQGHIARCQSGYT